MKLQDRLELVILYIKDNIIAVGCLGVAIMLTVSILNVLWQNYKINQDIDKIKNELVVLNDTNIELKNLIAYLKTDSFKEREARRKLDYQKPGEKVLLIPRSEAEKLRLDISPSQAEEKPKSKIQIFSNWKAWWEYMFAER